MVQVDLTVVRVEPIALEEVPHPDGQSLVALRTPSGRYVSITPQGQRQADALTAGAWERFLRAGSLYYAPRDGALYMVGPIVPTTIPYRP
mgnify:CR=1 FL=1